MAIEGFSRVQATSLLWFLPHTTFWPVSVLLLQEFYQGLKIAGTSSRLQEVQYEFASMHIIHLSYMCSCTTPNSWKTALLSPIRFYMN